MSSQPQREHLRPDRCGTGDRDKTNWRRWREVETGIKEEWFEEKNKNHKTTNTPQSLSGEKVVNNNSSKED